MRKDSAGWTDHLTWFDVEVNKKKQDAEKVENALLSGGTVTVSGMYLKKGECWK